MVRCDSNKVLPEEDDAVFRSSIEARKPTRKASDEMLLAPPEKVLRSSIEARKPRRRPSLDDSSSSSHGGGGVEDYPCTTQQQQSTSTSPPPFRSSIEARKPYRKPSIDNDDSETHACCSDWSHAMESSSASSPCQGATTLSLHEISMQLCHEFQQEDLTGRNLAVRKAVCPTMLDECSLRTLEELSAEFAE